MRRKLIGRKEFSGTVTVTDPCYEKGAWCTLDANVRKGLYDCYVWRDYDKFEINGEEFDDVNVGVIGIYLDGIIPSQKSMKLLGSIGVDAGLAGFFMNKPVYVTVSEMATLGLRVRAFLARPDTVMVAITYTASLTTEKPLPWKLGFYKKGKTI